MANQPFSGLASDSSELLSAIFFFIFYVLFLYFHHFYGLQYWCPPVLALCPLRSCRRSSPCCCCSCCCLCCVGTSSFYLYRLSCPILAAAVLLYYADAAKTLIFSVILSPGTTLLGSPIFPFRSAQLHTVPTFLHIFTVWMSGLFFCVLVPGTLAFRFLYLDKLHGFVVGSWFSLFSRLV